MKNIQLCSMKVCNKCKVEKSIEEYTPRKLASGTTIPHHMCRECKRVDDREKTARWRAANATKEQERARQKEKERPERAMYKRAKSRALAKNIHFTIVESDIVIPEYCPLLEIPLKLHYGGALDDSASLDRIDTTKGYTPENIRVISRKANIMKGNASLEELRLYLTNLPKYIEPCINSVNSGKA